MGNSPSRKIVEAVARREDVEIEEMPPLGFNPEYVDSLIDATRRVSVEVDYAGYVLRVLNDGSVEFVGPARRVQSE